MLILGEREKKKDTITKLKIHSFTSQTKQHKEPVCYINMNV